MSKKKPARRAPAKKAPAKRRVHHTAKAAAPKRSRRASVKTVAKRRSTRRSAPAGKMDIKTLIINAVVGVVGAVGVSMALGHIPAKKDGTPMIPAGVAPFAPIVSGLALAILMGKKNKLALSAGMGAMIGGGLSLAKAHLPKLGLGYDDDFQGEGYQLPPQLEEGAMQGHLLGWEPTSQGVNLGSNVNLAADVPLNDDDGYGADEYDGDTDDLI